MKMRQYLVKIDDSILPRSFTFDQLIDAGLLDNVDDKIKVKLAGDSFWITARDYPFSDVENGEGYASPTIHDEQRFAASQVTPTVHQYSTAGTSYESSLPTTPSILNKWNWGAFCLSWIWGICNGIYWPLILIVCNFLPFIGILCSLGICVYLGLNGNDMAWTRAKQKGTSVYSFERRQEKWNKVGLVLFLVSLVLGVFGVLMFML